MLTDPVLTDPVRSGIAATRTTWGAEVVAAAATDPTAVPAAGDWTVVADWSDGRATTEVVLPRRTAVVRAQVASGSTHGQVLAANADVVAVVEGMVPDPARADSSVSWRWPGPAVPSPSSS